MEARDEDTALGRADELLAGRPAVGHREIPRVSTRRVAAGVGRVAGALGREPLRGLPIVHDRARHAVVDERHPLLRRAFGIERQREGARVERVLPEGEERTGDLFAEVRFAVGAGHERAPVLERLAGEPGEAHETQHLGHREFLEDGLVIAWLELRPVVIARRLLDRAVRDRDEVMCRDRR